MTTSRRHFLLNGLRVAALGAIGSVAWLATRRSRTSRDVWQIDPRKCVQCGRCATHCVRKPSAVKCVHAFPICGYCQLCFGYFPPDASALDEQPQNQLCPTGAIVRKFVEEPYYEYTIDAEKCIGCAICVKGCGAFGNGSLHLQVDHSLCLNCNRCTIAEACPANAFVRVPDATPYLLKDKLSALRYRIRMPRGNPWRCA